MGRISDHLTKILGARYGRDVRQSIHDAIQQCYQDATGNPESVAAAVKQVDTMQKSLDAGLTALNVERLENVLFEGRGDNTFGVTDGARLELSEDVSQYDYIDIYTLVDGSCRTYAVKEVTKGSSLYFSVTYGDPPGIERFSFHVTKQELCIDVGYTVGKPYITRVVGRKTLDNAEVAAARVVDGVTYDILGDAIGAVYTTAAINQSELGAMREFLSTETDNLIDTLTVSKWRQGAFGDTSRTNQIEYHRDIRLTGGTTIYYGGVAGDSGVSNLNLHAYRADGTRIYIWGTTLNGFVTQSQAVPTDIAYIKVVLTGEGDITPLSVLDKRPKLFVSYTNMPTEAAYGYGIQYVDVGEMDSKIGAVAAEADSKIGVVAAEADTRLQALDGQVEGLRAEIGDLSGAFELVQSRNRLDPSTVQFNKWIYLDGRIVEDTNTFVFGQIPCKKGDVIYITALNAAGNFMGITATNFRRIVCYKSDGTVSSDTGKDYTNGYTVAGEDTAYFVFALDNANKGYQLFSVTINEYPTRAAEIDTYVAPYYALPLDKMVSDASLTVLPKTTIDCWGDSMTERGTPGTPYPQFLQEALGDGFTVHNYGISTQSSGEVAMRFGSNEVYVTLEGNQIPATVTPVKVTDMLCTRGDRWTGRNMVNFTSSKSVPCRLNGVPGQFSRTAFSDATFFTRDTAGDAVPVQPQSRLWCDNAMTEQNICIFWAGKNDTAFAAEYIVTGTVDCIYSMTNAMPHNHYVVLPVFHSLAHPSGDVYYRNITAINNKLAELHPDNYLDIQSMLMKHGLGDAGLTPTEEDAAAIQKGTLPPQLMGDDGTHPNEICRQVIAQYILDFLVSKQWIEGNPT